MSDIYCSVCGNDVVKGSDAESGVKTWAHVSPMRHQVVVAYEENDLIEDLTIALDVDGVVSPVTPAGSGTPENVFDGWNYRMLSSRNFGAAVSEEVIALLKTLMSDGAKIKWHTSWREAAVTHLSPELEVPIFEQFAESDAPHSTGGWWKLEAVQQWLKDTEGTVERLIWIDDGIVDSVASGQIPSNVLHHPRLSMISPQTYWGLSPADLDDISGAAYTDSRIDLVNDPSRPRPLPQTPGSVIAWGELEDTDTGERWAATACAIANPDGGVTWADAFVDAETPSSLFEVEHLNSVEWFRLVETVPASEAPKSIQESFAEGDVIVGSVFESDLEDMRVDFTTAPGVYYSGELSEVFAIDIYGNLYTAGDRDVKYLPTELV